MDVSQQLKLIVETIHKHKGEKINVIKITEVSSIADYFVIATARNPVHCQALARYIEERLKQKGRCYPLHVEGGRQGEWILVDYGDVIVHLFTDEQRQHYNLDKLWGDADQVDLSQWIDKDVEEETSRQ